MGRKLFFGAVIFLGIFSFGADDASAAGPTIIADTEILTPTVWAKSGSPYIIHNRFDSSLIVRSSLTIEPGVVVKFYSKNTALSITPSGILTAIGTADENIVFTSFKDDTYGGDSNNDGNATAAVKGEWYAIINNGTAVFDNATVLYGGSGPGTAAIFSYSNNLAVKNSTIRYAAYSGIALYNVSTTVIENNVISDNTTGIRLEKFVSGKVVKVSGNTIANNQFGATVAGITPLQMSVKLSAENNWWGDTSGPYYSPGIYYGRTFPVPANLSGKGNLVTDGVSFSPWLGSDPSEKFKLCAENCYSNVMFLPGLQASRLYGSDGSEEDRLWEPGSDADAEELYLDENGKSIRDDISTKDVIDNAYLPVKGNIYKSFLSDLDRWKNEDGLIYDYAVAPYDWRLSLDDILESGKKTGEHISYTEPTTSPYIIGELRRLAGTSKSGKVTLIAHSNGGLVAKALVSRLGAEAADLIDKIVFVAVPQSGTPQAIGAILHGYEQGLPVDWFPFALKPRAARTFAQNMPSAYNFLPSDAYFSGEGSGVTTPVITFKGGESTQPFIDDYGEKIDTSAEMQSFLLNDTGKVAADSADIVSPSRVNSRLLPGSGIVHQVLDDLVIPSSISVYQIAGFGEETLGTIRYWTGEECLHEGGKICSSRVSKLEYTPELVVDGDGTVVAPSALAMSTVASNISRWWVNLFEYNDDNIRRKHASILEIQGLRDFIKSNIIQSSVPLPEFISTSEPLIDSSRHLRYFLHSPLALSARDSAGNEISATEDAYPGATFRRFGEVQYISVPADSAPTLVMDGIDTGSFTLEIQEVEGDVVTAIATFAGIPSSADTKVTMDFADGTIADASPLTVDYDGNGTADFSLEPSLGETVVFDIAPPTTAASVAGTQGSNDWYASDVIVTLAAQDEDGGSGVATTEYSLDNGVHWNTYTDPLGVSQEGINTILYSSTDKQGNEEETKTLSVKIDKTAPEISFGFDPAAQELTIVGNDSISAVITDVSPTIVSVTDEAGHTTNATFEKNEAGKQIKFEIRSLAYDGIPVSLLPATLNYEWSLEKTEDVKMLNEMAVVGDTKIRAHYLVKDNATVITRTENSVTISETKPGLTILRMVTENGEVQITY